MATKKSKPRVPRDNEIAAMAAMVRILKRLSHEARLEVVEFASRRVQRMQAEEIAAKTQQQPTPFPILATSIDIGRVEATNRGIYEEVRACSEQSL